MASVQFTTAGSSLWTVPLNVFSVTIECYGGGAPGGSLSYTNSHTGGGSGGCYAKKTLAVLPGQTLRVNVAASKSAVSGGSGNGNPSSVDDNGSTVYCLAPGGIGGSLNQAGVGSTTGAIGDIISVGGNGALRTTTPTGGGGGAAGSTTIGGNASGFTGGVGGGGLAGNGGNGNTWTTYTNGSSGQNYGGGGSGAKGDSSQSVLGGSGAQGAVVITYPDPALNHFFALFSLIIKKRK